MEEGQTVRLVQPVIEGVIIDVRYNKIHKCLEHLLEWYQGTEKHNRWFLESALEEVTDE